jgi:peroxiredoxin
MLKTGSTFPDIALEDTTGRPVHVKDYRGKDNVLLFFMRSTSCPVCNRHVTDLTRRSADLAADQVQVLVAVPEGREQAAAWQARRGLPFPVVTGRQGTPHEAIGLTRKVFGALQQSGSVLIDLDGIIRHAHSATMPVSSYDKRGITQAIRDLRTSSAGPRPLT